MTRAGETAILTLRLATQTPSVVLLEVHDTDGRRVARRRVHGTRLSLTLPSGTYRVTATDERALHDPARLGATTCWATTGGETTITLVRGIVLRATTTPWARLSAVHADGERVEVRADVDGLAVVTGLRRGTWTVSAHDRRRDRCSESVVVILDRPGTTGVDLPARTPSSRLLVHVRGGDRRPLLATEVVVTDPSGRRVTAPVREGLADVRGLRPGHLSVTLPASVGHLGTTVGLTIEAGTLGVVEAVSPVGASISGRVVQGGRQYAAVVALLDAEGAELERVRTDEDGSFVLGTGLRATDGLTVVATSGPESLHVTRAAVADVSVLGGVRHHLGDIALPVAGRRAAWTARTPAAAGMQLPSPRV